MTAVDQQKLSASHILLTHTRLVLHKSTVEKSALIQMLNNTNTLTTLQLKVVISMAVLYIKALNEHKTPKLLKSLVQCNFLFFFCYDKS